MFCKKKLLLVIVAFFFVLLNGCKSKLSISGEGKIITSDDGYPLITYRLKMKPDVFKGKPPRAVLFYIQGSAYETVFSNMGVLAGVAALDTSVIVLERRGIDENQNVALNTCYKYSSKEVRVKDHLRVIDEYLKGVPPDIPVILMGESEGGDVAAVVASKESRVTHLILFASGGGWTQAEECEFSLSTKGECLNVHSLAELNSIFEDIKAHPDSLKMWAGHPYQRWSSYLWYRPIDYLVNLDIPIFLAHGDKDESVPVENARAVKKRFDELGKANLTYKEYKNVGHSFVHISPLFEVDLIEWMEQLRVITKDERAIFEKRVKKAHPEFFK